MPEADSTTAVAEPQTRVRWGLWDAAGGWLLAMVGAQITAVIALAASGLEPDQIDELPLRWLAFAQVGLWLGLAGVPFVVTRLKGNGMVRDLGLRITARDVPVGGACGLVAQYAVLLLYLPLFWLSDVDTEDISAPARDLSDRAADPLGVALLVLIVGIGAPIVEEIFYRGLLQRALIRRIGTRWGVVVAALVFGAVHFQPLQFPALAAFGVVAGILTVRYGRLGPAIAAHMLFNISAVVALVASS